MALCPSSSRLSILGHWGDPMNTPPTKMTPETYLDQHDQRQWERQEYRTSMTLVLTDGRVLKGETYNVSPGGISLSVQEPLDGVTPTETAELHISPYKGSPYFPCTIARVFEGGVGLKFSSDQATFGAYISHDMLLSLLGKINNAFAQSLDLRTTIETGVSEIKAHLQAEASSLFLVGKDGSTVICSACAGPVNITGLEISVNEGIVGRTIREKSPQTVHNVSDDPFFTHAIDQKTGFKTVSLLCAPMVIEGQVLGALEVVNKRGTGFFTKSDEVALVALASATALAIHNARQATELIEKEARIRASDMNYHFISSLNHRLHTPLNTVMGFAQLLETDQSVMSSDIGKDGVPQIVSAGQNLINMVDAILSFAELEGGKVKVNIAPLHPLDTYEACLEDAHIAAKNRSVTITDQIIDLSDLPAIAVDGVRCRHVMENILQHAICACPPHGTIVLSSATTNEAVRFSITFENECAEIPNTAIPFTPNTQCGEEELDGTCTGLELAISHKLVALMNGDIDMVLVDDGHTTIWFEFPIA